MNMSWGLPLRSVRLICSRCSRSIGRKSVSEARVITTNHSSLSTAHQNVQIKSQRRLQHSSSAEDPEFVSVADNPPQLVRSGRRHGPGLIILALIPVTAFALGSWQIQRLDWKTKMIAKFEDRLVRDPLPLPGQIDPQAVPEFDYRRVYATGRYRHDQEMLIGPRVHDGKDGYLVITPLERDGSDSTILVNRGWIPRVMKKQKDRKEGALPKGRVTVQGLLREPWKQNMFTPANRPEKNEFYFPDVAEMAAHTGSASIWIEATMVPDLITAYNNEEKGIPIGRPAEVNLRNNHAQYIFTWYGLAAATSLMLWMVIRKPSRDITRRVRQSKDWQ